MKNHYKRPWNPPAWAVFFDVIFSSLVVLGFTDLKFLVNPETADITFQVTMLVLSVPVTESILHHGYIWRVCGRHVNLFLTQVLLR